MLSILAFLALVPSLSSATMAPRRAIRKAPSSKSRASGTKPSKFKPFPPPKKGVQRMIHKRLAGKKNTDWVKTPYLQKKFAAATCRRDRKHWKRSVQQLLAADDAGMIRILIEDGFLPNMEGKTCLVQQRCPEGHSLQVQSVALLMLLSNVPLSTVHILTQINHNALERMWRSLVFLRKDLVEKKGKEIHFGKKGCCQDVEADEATFDKLMSDSLVHWEQWAGAIRKVDWKPLEDRLLKDRQVILHTDSARSYKAKVRGVLHDSVVHQKKRVKVRGKLVWRSPNFVKLVTHKLPCGKKLRVKAGTQIIDRTWRFIKDRLRLNQVTQVGSSLLRAQIQSAQYEYWYRNRDLWACTGELLSAYMRDILVYLPVSAATHSGGKLFCLHRRTIN
eukprot:s526_g39.t1